MLVPTGYTFSLVYDMRAPDFGAPAVDLYQAAIRQSEWADRIGFRDVHLLEHHATSDGYLPSPLMLGAAIAGVTHRMLIRTNVALLPLYHPLRFAEDTAVLDLLSNGRLRLTVAAGYRAAEYAQFGLDIRTRPSLMEENLEVLKQAWTGEPFDWRGRTVRVLPRPVQVPRPEIVLGGSSPASAARAARLADGYAPVVPHLYDVYLRELEALGKTPPVRQREVLNDALFFHIAEDPDSAWERIAPHAMHETNEYARWAGNAKGSPYSAVDDPAELRKPGKYEVVTPEEAVVLIRARGGAAFKPLMGGLAPDLAWESLELFESKVLPRLEAISPAAPTRSTSQA